MPGGVNFSSLDFGGNAGNIDRQLLDHLFMLKEQLEYTLTNLDGANFNYKFFDELTVRVQDGLNIEGIVTFDALANNDSTIINGAYIKTGIVEASRFKTYTYSKTTATYGELLMYWAYEEDDPPEWDLLAGGIRMDDEGLGTDVSSRYRLWIYTKELENTDFKVSLKLSSAYRASLEAKSLLYVFCDAYDGDAGRIVMETGGKYGYIELRTFNIDMPGTLIDIGDKATKSQNQIRLYGKVEIDGELYVNGVKIG